MIHIDDIAVYVVAVSGEEMVIYRYIYNRSLWNKLQSKQFAQKKHHKKGGSSQGRYQRDTEQVVKQIANELALIINREIPNKDDKIVFVSQGNLSYIHSKLVARVVAAIPSLDPTNFLYNKKNVDECVDREVVQRAPVYRYYFFDI
jgi:hypothetical protein